jgi:hypothetical protein
VLTTKTVNDGSGRVQIVEHDDRGEPEQLTLPVVGDFRLQGAYAELISVPMNRDQQQPGKGSARLGLLLFSANVSPPTTVGADYVVLDCIVYGYLASAATVIKRMAFGSGAPDDFLRLDDSNNYDRIGVAGRQIVNGRPDSTTALAALSLTVVGRVSR